MVVGTRAPHLPLDVAESYQDSFGYHPTARAPNFEEVNVSDKPLSVRQLPGLTQDRLSSMQSDHRARLRSMLSMEDLLRQMLST